MADSELSRQPRGVRQPFEDESPIISSGQPRSNADRPGTGRDQSGCVRGVDAPRRHEDSIRIRTKEAADVARSPS